MVCLQSSLIVWSKKRCLVPIVSALEPVFVRAKNTSIYNLAHDFDVVWLVFDLFYGDGRCLIVVEGVFTWRRHSETTFYLWHAVNLFRSAIRTKNGISVDSQRLCGSYFWYSSSSSCERIDVAAPAHWSYLNVNKIITNIRHVWRIQ